MRFRGSGQKWQAARNCNEFSAMTEVPGQGTPVEARASASHSGGEIKFGMVRSLRIVVPGVWHHVVSRGVD